jgi:hypothetical protein
MGKWIGVDEESKGVRVYWPDTKTVTVERNTYFDNSSADRLEREENVDDLQFIEIRDDSPDTIEATPTLHDPLDVPVVREPQDHDDDPNDAPEHGKRTRKPTQKVQDLLEGRGMWSTDANAPLLPPGIQFLAEGGADDDDPSDWLIDVPAHVEGYVFAAVIAGSEALEP